MVVLGCDGVWERMTNEEVGRFVFERRGEEGIEGGNGKQGEDLGGVVEKCLDLLLAPDC
jgi:serine/threonine protein phosphatase PrpC